MRIGCVVLTTGERGAELAAAVASVRAQRGVDVEVVVVLNAELAGTGPDSESGAAEGEAARGAPAHRAGTGPSTAVGSGLGDDCVRWVRPGRNLGIPGGRNLGVAHCDDVDLVLFLDDDARLLDDDALVGVVDRFAADPGLGAVSLRLVDPDTGATARRHVPRLRVGDPARSSLVTTFLGGASVVRRDAFEAAGGLPAEFFYAHEETSLAWRLLDRGWRIRYLGDVTVAHPVAPPARHAAYHHLTGRNRVLLARRHLPVPLAVVYVGLWLVLGLARSAGGRAALLRGFRDGLRQTDVDRDPISWRTVWRMTRYGRPPLI